MCCVARAARHFACAFFACFLRFLVFLCVANARAGRAVFRTTSIAKKFVDTAEIRSKQVCICFHKGNRILCEIFEPLKVLPFNCFENYGMASFWHVNMR